MFDSATQWTVAHQAPLSMGFSWQEYWSGLPSPSPVGLPVPGIQPSSLESPALAGRFLISTATWEACAPFLNSLPVGSSWFPFRTKARKAWTGQKWGHPCLYSSIGPAGPDSSSWGSQTVAACPARKVSAGPLTEQGGVTPESPDPEHSLPAPFQGHSAVWSSSRAMLSFGPCTLLSLENHLPVGQELLL